MASRGQRLWASPSAVDLRVLVEAALVIAATWLVLGWTFQRPISQADGTVAGVPLTQGALHAGLDWTRNLYRFGVIGGSEMHGFGGSLPVVQLCAALGLSTTVTVNAVTVFLQLGFGFFGIQAIEALVSRARGAAVRLSVAPRIAAIWLCSFAPVLGWRLAYGHENLLLGLLPLYTALALLWAARAGTLSGTALGFAAFVVFNGVSGFGAQTLIYSAVFGAPLVVVTVLDAPRGQRWGRPQWAAAAALAAGVLVALPRLAPMIHHAFGADATRSVGDAVTYRYGAASAADWLTSIPWTSRFAAAAAGTQHEHNFPLGPIILLVALAWPRGLSRRTLWALVAGAALAIAFADDVAPVSTALLRLPLLPAFRVPARAILPIVMFVPCLAVAACYARHAAPRRELHGLALVAGALVILGARTVPPVAREVVAWLGCAALAAVARFRPAVLERSETGGSAPRGIERSGLVAALPVIAALGVAAFDERFPRDLPFDPVEDGPRQLHAAVIAQAPGLATALNRVEVVDALPPYDMGTAWAAELASLDGIWYPPRRFLDLLAAFDGKPVDPTTCVFHFARSRVFPLLQQLYNVRYEVSVADRSIRALPPTPGAAWFPARVAAIDRPDDLIAALRGTDLRAALTATAWVMRSDAAAAPAAAADAPCTATVTGVATDELGQAAAIGVTAPRACSLVVATSYVSTLRATARVGGALRDAAVFPIDVALTGIAVPAGASLVTLAPEVDIPAWSRAASLLGLALLAAAILALRRRADG
ncbi:MAG TPA: hypothetical protein VHT91_36925 [Kofleriaceae bacterium]|jgi:hypothetical protein|nr:hypothetical protein [Kofleriaceae bacterium]